MLQSLPVLQQSRWLRYATLCLLYVSQGLPIGLFQVALPAWFASQGLTLSQVGGFIAIVFLPWSFKLLAGPVMDRFAFPPMGRRRPWVLFAQGGLVVSFILLAILSPDPNESYYLLAALGFLSNSFGALQDVAVDGMAIDILEEDERAQANAYMFGGQVAGTSVAGAVGSAALLNFGLIVTGLIMAVAVFLIMLMPLVLRERKGERMLPWSEGQASPEALAAVNDSWKDIIVTLIRALVLPMSVLLVLLESFQRMAAGMLVAINPVITVQDLGWIQTEYTNWVSLAGITAAVIGVVFGPWVDRAGAFRVLVAAIGFRMLLFAGFGLFQDAWSNVEFYKAMLMASQISQQFVTITIIACLMRLCFPAVAATQFAVYMASANLTSSMGSAMIVPLNSYLDHQQLFYFIAALHLVFLLCAPFFNFERHAAGNERLHMSLAKP